MNVCYNGYMTWKRNISDSSPQDNQRVLVSDGETITIAYKVTQESQVIWLFDNPQLKDLKIFWWDNLPELPPKINTESNTI